MTNLQNLLSRKESLRIATNVVNTMNVSEEAKMREEILTKSEIKESKYNIAGKAIEIGGAFVDGKYICGVVIVNGNDKYLGTDEKVYFGSIANCEKHV